MAFGIHVLMATFAADLESSFLNEKLSGVHLILREEEDYRKRKRESTDTTASEFSLPGHSMLLLAYSGFFNAKLEHWSEINAAGQSNDHKHSIEIRVPAGQLDLAQRLVKGMYQAVPDYTDLHLAELVPLILLADRYVVPKVQAAAVDALQAVSAAQWSWDLVLAVLDMPPSCAEQACCRPAIDAAYKMVRQQLGDLERVWLNESLQQQLLALPFMALLRLLQDGETCVISKHTVVYTILEWYAQQPQDDPATRQVMQLKQLLHQVRMNHCSQLYIHKMMMHNSLILQCFSVEELATASLCTEETLVLKDVKETLLQRYPAWTAPARPRSNQQQTLEWMLPMTELQKVVEKHLTHKRAAALQSSTSLLQAQPLKLEVEVQLATEGCQQWR